MGMFGLKGAVRRWLGVLSTDQRRVAAPRRQPRRPALRGEWLESREMMALLAPDLAVFRPSDLTVRIDYSATGLNGQTEAVIPMQGIAATDIALTGDINGDTMGDLAFFRPSTGEWRIDYDRNGLIDQTLTYIGNGPLDGNLAPVVGDVSGAGYASLGVYHRDTGLWEFIDGRTFTFGGQAGDVPMLGDMNVDGRADLMIYNPTVFVADPTYGDPPFNRTGNWKQKFNSLDYGGSHNNYPDFVYSFGPFIQASDKPVLVFTPSPQLGIHTSDVNGTRWLIDTDFNAFTQPPDGPEAAYFYTSPTTADVPLVGYFDTRSSIFVSPNGSDAASGAFGSPLRTINAAVARAPDGQGQIIRVGAGTYREPVNPLVGRYDLTFQGTGPLASVLAPTAGDAMMLDRSSNIWFNGIHFRPDSGRGLVAIGSDVNTLNINTAGSMFAGGLGVGYPVAGPTTRRTNWLAIGSHFDSVSAGDGVALQHGASGTFSFSTFNASRGFEVGRGLTLEGDSIAVVDSSAFVGNSFGGITAAGNSDLKLTRSAIANNWGDGVVLQQNAAADIQSNYFASNGISPESAIELLADYTGLARITGNTFADSTAFGVRIVGSTQFVEIRGNYFDFRGSYADRAGISMNGAVDVNGQPNGSISRAIIQGNLFELSTYFMDRPEKGIFLTGSGVTATIGGAASSEVNVFRGYEANNAIAPSRFDSNFPGFDFGCPMINSDVAAVNLFVDTTAPYVRAC